MCCVHKILHCYVDRVASRYKPFPPAGSYNLAACDPTGHQRLVFLHIAPLPSNEVHGYRSFRPRIRGVNVTRRSKTSHGVLGHVLMERVAPIKQSITRL